MAREDSPYIVGDFWLDKRRDGKSSAWQITSYDTATRQVVYRSTRTDSIDAAKPIIHAHADRARSRQQQSPDEARVIPLLLTYWEEHGRKAVSPAQIASSLRAFMGFLFQDEAGMNAVVTDMTPALLERFREWRMGPHEYDVPWGGKDFTHRSSGVNGETVQRNLDDLRASLNHAANNSRLPFVPKIQSVASRYRSPARDRVLSIDELGMIFWYARHFPDFGRYVALMIGTAVRPEAAMAFTPAQYTGARTVDLHPPHWERTEKHNPIVPVIRPLRLILRRWKLENYTPVKSRARAWRTMRAALGLSSDVVAKTIRHTLATMLYADESVPERQISDLLGHTTHINRTTRVYAKYNPAMMRQTEAALSSIWLKISRAARAYGAVHLLSKADGNGPHRVDRIER
jgi:integrase